MTQVGWGSNGWRCLAAQGVDSSDSSILGIAAMEANACVEKRKMQRAVGSRAYAASWDSWRRAEAQALGLRPKGKYVLGHERAVHGGRRNGSRVVGGRWMFCFINGRGAGQCMYLATSSVLRLIRILVLRRGERERV